MDIQLIRNATVKLNYNGKTFLVDPFFADKLSLPPFAGKSLNPTVDLPLSIAEIMKDVDAIFITHLHPDHFDQKAQENIPKSMPLFVQPSDEASLIKMGFTQVNVIKNEIEIAGVKINRVDAQHGEGEILKAMGTVSGYVFTANEEPTLYLTGDTIWCNAVKETLDRYQPQMVVANAGGNAFSPQTHPFQEFLTLKREYTVVMNQKQVLEMMQFMPAVKVIIAHIGALDHETVTRKEMKDFLLKNGVDNDFFFILDDGEVIQVR